jgi:surface polysaccharide O-acyltransferase-like enzyme
MMQPTFPVTAILMYGMGFLSILMGLGLIVSLLKNLDLSQWTKVALIGILLMLISGAFTLAFPFLMRRVNAASVIGQFFFLSSVFRVLGQFFFIVGISATLFDVRNQLRIAQAMLNKPATDDLT